MCVARDRFKMPQNFVGGSKRFITPRLRRILIYFDKQNGCKTHCGSLNYLNYSCELKRNRAEVKNFHNIFSLPLQFSFDSHFIISFIGKQSQNSKQITESNNAFELEDRILKNIVTEPLTLESRDIN